MIFHLDITDVINAMQMGNVIGAQHSELLGFLIHSSAIIKYLEVLVERSLLIENQTVSGVNLLLEVRHTIWDYFTLVDESPYFLRFNLIEQRMVFRNLH